ncbi:hypothetical protein HY486_01480 [Candidatus Woesearchaeota archaeon]|nr:hypothetical protein [Candidatus Woesearchaeota archaeon]
MSIDEPLTQISLLTINGVTAEQPENNYDNSKGIEVLCAIAAAICAYNGILTHKREGMNSAAEYYSGRI